MSNRSLIRLPRSKCMKCQEETDILMSAFSQPELIGLCVHKFCQNCFRKENINSATSLTHTFTCPCCNSRFYKDIISIDEAILIGEAAGMRADIYSMLMQSAGIVIAVRDVLSINQKNREVVEKLEAALRLNPTNTISFHLLQASCVSGQMFLTNRQVSESLAEFYKFKMFSYGISFLDATAIPGGHVIVKTEGYYELASIFYVHNNYPPALKYAKLAYEHCLRSSDIANMDSCKDLYLGSRAAFAEMNPLRFAVGDEVEFLHECDGGEEWKLGKVIELHYREIDFAIAFNAPYRLQLLDVDEGESSVYAWVKADLDRYVRKVGVRSIEDTRYQARLDAKIEELAHVYRSKEFLQGIYRTLAQDRAFVEMMQLVWQLELSEPILYLYRMLVMYRQPLVRIDSGYHLLSTEEAITGIRAYFDPAHLSSDATPPVTVGNEGDSQSVRAQVLRMFRNTASAMTDSVNDLDVQGLLLWSLQHFLGMLHAPESAAGLRRGGGSTIPPELSDAIAKVSSSDELRALHTRATTERVASYVIAWVGLHMCLEDRTAGPACECPYVHVFVKFCLDQGFGVPKLALALFDRMNMQLSREFIRCAYPTCELNRLDQSTGQVKFKLCSRCRAVIYCSRECQVAHYPQHKKLCTEHSTGQRESYSHMDTVD